MTTTIISAAWCIASGFIPYIWQAVYSAADDTLVIEKTSIFGLFHGFPSFLLPVIYLLCFAILISTKFIASKKGEKIILLCVSGAPIIVMRLFNMFVLHRSDPMWLAINLVGLLLDVIFVMLSVFGCFKIQKKEEKEEPKVE